jgi:polyisoprenoid-binding protein YceI
VAATPSPAPGDSIPGAWVGPAGVSQLSIGSRNAEVRFHLRFLRLIEVRGWFEGIEGELEFDDADSRLLSLVARLPVNGIRTGNRLRDRHLRSHNWLDVEAHPFIEFHSTQVMCESGGVLVRGIVRIKGVERSAIINCRPSSGWSTSESPREFTGEMTVRRSAFQVGPSPRGIAPWDPRAYLMEDGIHLHFLLRLRT